MSKAVCPSCGGRNATSRVLKDYRYEESGLSNVHLHGRGVTEITCPHCGDRHVLVASEWQLLQVLTIALLQKEVPLTGAEMRFVRSGCQLTQEALAKKLGVRRETVVAWESRANPGIVPGNELLLRAMLILEFRRILADPENNYLAPVHKGLVEDLEKSFSRYAERVLRPRRSRPISFHQVKRQWKPEPQSTGAVAR